jgi:hypothetical protein
MGKSGKLANLKIWKFENGVGWQLAMGSWQKLNIEY